MHNKNEPLRSGSGWSRDEFFLKSVQIAQNDVNNKIEVAIPSALMYN